uniref:Uncharacterized protein n=1 Tax=Timema poppense TaxID=170557 RepID=A0A7R9H3B9_TIMPO|nr:unnamed protein product [Timema poppensis]
MSVPADWWEGRTRVSRVASYLPEQPGLRGVRTAKKGRGEMVTPSYPFVEGRDPSGGTDKVKLWSSVVKKRNRVERASVSPRHRRLPAAQHNQP